MINRYKRWARGHQDRNLGDWVPLHMAIPELADGVEHVSDVHRSDSAEPAAGASSVV